MIETALGSGADAVTLDLEDKAAREAARRTPAPCPDTARGKPCPNAKAPRDLAARSVPMQRSLKTKAVNRVGPGKGKCLRAVRILRAAMLRPAQ